VANLVPGTPDNIPSWGPPVVDPKKAAEAARQAMLRGLEERLGRPLTFAELSRLEQGVPASKAIPELATAAKAQALNGSAAPSSAVPAPSSATQPVGSLSAKPPSAPRAVPTATVTPAAQESQGRLVSDLLRAGRLTPEQLKALEFNPVGPRAGMKFNMAADPLKMGNLFPTTSPTADPLHLQLQRAGRMTPEQLKAVEAPIGPRGRMKLNMSKDFFRMGGDFPVEPSTPWSGSSTGPQTVGGDMPATARRASMLDQATPAQRMSYNTRFPIDPSKGYLGDGAQNYVERELLNARGATPSSPLRTVTPETPVSIRGLGGGAAGAADDLATQAARTLTRDSLKSMTGESAVMSKNALRNMFGQMAEAGGTPVVQATKGMSTLPGLAGKAASFGIPEGALTALGGWKGGVAGMAAGFAGGMLDSSDWLGGEDSTLNNAASNALRYGGLGAGIGSFIPGVGGTISKVTGAIGGVLDHKKPLSTTSMKAGVTKLLGPAKTRGTIAYQNIANANRASLGLPILMTAPQLRESPVLPGGAVATRSTPPCSSQALSVSR